MKLIQAVVRISTFVILSALATWPSAVAGDFDPDIAVFQRIVKPFFQQPWQGEARSWFATRCD
jgi:hypothetical protein